MNFRNLKWAKLYKFVLSGPPSKKKKKKRKCFLNLYYKSFNSDFIPYGQNEGVSDILARGKCLVGIPNPPFQCTYIIIKVKTSVRLVNSFRVFK